jgi:predicted SprT family Zn-dependent metalloprotease
MDLDEAQRESMRLMREHGLLGWGFRFDEGRRTFGRCRHNDKTISLSRRLTRLNDWSHVKATMLHEIAHALVGPNHGHDAAWRAMAVRLGTNPARCFEASYVEGDGKVKVPPRVTRVSFK